MSDRPRCRYAYLTLGGREAGFCVLPEGHSGLHSHVGYFAKMTHAEFVRAALAAAEIALRSAEQNGRRTGCLRSAAESLRGALRCVEWEDEELAHNSALAAVVKGTVE